MQMTSEVGCGSLKERGDIRPIAMSRETGSATTGQKLLVRVPKNITHSDVNDATGCGKST